MSESFLELKKFVFKQKGNDFVAEILDFETNDQECLPADQACLPIRQKRFFFIFETEKKNKEKIIESFSFFLEKEQKPNDISTYKFFEEILLKINRVLSLILKEDKNFQGTIFFIEASEASKKNKLYFSHTEKSKVFLLRKNNFFRIDQEFSLKKDSKDFFPYIVSGEISLNDKIFFYTPSLEKYLSLERIKKAFSEEKNFFSSFQNSLKILKPRQDIGIAFLEKKSGHFWNKNKNVLLISLFLKFVKNLRQSPIAQQMVNQSKKAVSPKIKLINQKISDFGKKASQPIFEKIKKTKFLEKTRLNIIIVKLRNALKLINPVKFVLQLFNRVNPQKRILGFGLLIILLIFLINFNLLEKKHKKEEKINHLNSLFNKVEKAEADASNFLIYNNETEAQMTIEKAFQTIEEIEKDLSNQTEKNKEKVNDWKKKLTVLFEKVNHFQKIENPKIIFELSFEPIGFLKIDSDFYFYDNKSIFLGSEKIFSFDADKEIIKGNLFGKELIFFDQNSNFFKFNSKEKRLEKISLSFLPADKAGHLENPEITDLGIYEKKIYFLDKKNNQIFRHNQILDVFSKGQVWLKDKVDLQDVISIAVDGSIYLLKKDGQIMKFHSGTQVPYEFEEIFPAFSSPSKIFTDFNSSFIYILDPDGERILVFDKKTQKLKTQFVSEKFDQLVDFFVVEKEKKIYLLNGKKVFEIDL